MWQDLSKTLNQLGILEVNRSQVKELKSNNEQIVQVEPASINKVCEYCEGEEGNITLSMKCNDVETFAILESGAGVAIATKSIWEAWGKPTIRRTRMKLQLVDEHLERSLGLLESIVVSSCDVEYVHTFAIIDFGSKPTYDVILGHHFMRQLKVI